MIQKKEIQKTSSKNRKRRISTDILFGAFVLVTVSGLILLYIRISGNKEIFRLNQWWWAFIHRISALVSLLFTMPHVYKHRNWYKKLFPIKQKSKITVILSFSFFITLLTTIALVVKKNSVSLEIAHSVISIIAVVFILIHAFKRYHIIK